MRLVKPQLFDMKYFALLFCIFAVAFAQVLIIFTQPRKSQDLEASLIQLTPNFFLIS